MMASLERSLVEALVARFAPGALVREVTRLEGGVSSLMTRVELEGQGPWPKRVVMRRMGAYTSGHDPESLRRESDVLRALDRAHVPVPPIVFADLDGMVIGEPVLVLEYLEGEVASAVADPPTFACEVADAMATIHRLDTTGWMTADPSPLSAPEPAPDRTILADAYRALSPHLGALPPHPALLHGDFWPGNMLVQ
jgi:aminoglycoside phosphotransferase (APT) family kinase protein